MLVDLSRGLPTPDWSLTYPQLIIFGLALLLMILDAFVPQRHHYALLTSVSRSGHRTAGTRPPSRGHSGRTGSRSSCRW